MLVDALPYALALAAGLLGLLFAPAVDRWVDGFDAWVEGWLRQRAEPPT